MSWIEKLKDELDQGFPRWCTVGGIIEHEISSTKDFHISTTMIAMKVVGASDCEYILEKIYGPIAEAIRDDHPNWIVPETPVRHYPDAGPGAIQMSNPWTEHGVEHAMYLERTGDWGPRTCP